jgi:hypothetical protein
VTPHGESRLKFIRPDKEPKPAVRLTRLSSGGKENSPSGLWRQLGKLVGCKPSGVRIPHSPRSSKEDVH